jgi:succinate dehydrogenase hydrophobic anchor subunit
MSQRHFLGLDTSLKKALFWGYVGSWTMQGLAVHSALIFNDDDDSVATSFTTTSSGVSAPSPAGRSSHGHLMYNVTAMVILIEVAKLSASACMYAKFDYRADSGILPKNWQKVFLYYFAPATLYAVYNTMMHVILTRISPSTYYVPLQLRLLTTAVIFSWVFKKTFSKQKWTALGVITFGCVFKELGAKFLGGSVGGGESIPVPVYFMLAFQIFASTAASVACEVLLKDFKHISTNMQNIFMYVTSIMINQAAMLVLPGAGGGATKAEQGVGISAFSGVLFHPLSLFICLNGAAGGILTGFLLANLTSVHKALAVTIEILLLGVLSSLMFGTELGMIGSLSIVVVAAGSFMYSGYTWKDLLELIQGGPPSAAAGAVSQKDGVAIDDVKGAAEQEKSGLLAGP